MKVSINPIKFLVVLGGAIAAHHFGGWWGVMLYLGVL